MRMTQLDAAKLRAAYGCPSPNIPKLLANQEAVKRKKHFNNRYFIFSHLFVFQSFALTIETPCVWVENRRRDANGVQIKSSDSVRWKYHYEGEMRGSFSILVTRLRPRVEREKRTTLSLAQQLFCFPSRRTTFSADRNPMSGSGAGGQSIEDYFFEF